VVDYKYNYLPITTVLTLYSNGQFRNEESFIDKGKMGHYFQDLYTDWYSNEPIREQGNYDDNMKQGMWYTWHENGQLMTEQQYYNDDLQGLYTKWNRNGKIIEQGHYNEDLKVGIWYTWYNTKGKGIGEDEAG